MAETVTIKIEKARGYSGIRSGKSYIAKISGTDPKYIFSRDFIETEATDKAECFNARRKGKGTWIEAAALEPGLYEICRYGEKSYYMVSLKENNAVGGEIADNRVNKMVLLMDEGKSFEESRLATKSPKNEITK